jgi:hypothetical protein
MKRILDAINKDLQYNNHYSALYVSLSLIDSCAKIEYHKNENRYVAWLNKYYLPLYERDLMNPMLPANAIYQLRCSVLHEGTNHIKIHDKKKYNDIKGLSKIILVATPFIHRNIVTINNNIVEIQLSVAEFVKEITNSILKWMENKNEGDYELDFSIETGAWSTTTFDGFTAIKVCE